MNYFYKLNAYQRHNKLSMRMRFTRIFKCRERFTYVGGREQNDMKILNLASG